MVPHPALMGGTPSGRWASDTSGSPCQGWVGYPLSGLDGGTPSGQDRMGKTPIPVRIGWGYPPRQDWMGEPHPPSPPRQNSRTSTCHTADGMPLAFIQDDFLVTNTQIPTDHGHVNGGCSLGKRLHGLIKGMKAFFSSLSF